RHTIFSRDWSSDVCSSDLATVVNNSSGKSSVPNSLPFFYSIVTADPSMFLTNSMGGTLSLYLTALIFSSVQEISGNVLIKSNFLDRMSRRLSSSHVIFLYP